MLSVILDTTVGPEDDEVESEHETFDPAEDCDDPDWWEDNFNSDPID
jgi:hypothetical protein